MAVVNRDLSETIAAIYDSAIDATRWPEALRLMCGLVGSDTGGIAVHAAGTHTALLNQRWGGDPYWLRLFEEKYAALLPFHSVLPRLDVGVVFNNEALLDELGDRSVLEGPFFKEWVEPAGYCDTICAVVMRSGCRSGTFSLLLPAARGPSTPRDLEVVGLLSPHVLRAIAIGDLLDMRALAMDTLDRTLDQLAIGVLVVDARCRLLYANRAAEQVMASDGGLRSERGCLRAVSPTADAALAAAIARAAVDPAGLGQSGIGIPLPGGLGRPRIAHLLPLRGPDGSRSPLEAGVAAVFISQQATASLTLQDGIAGLFGLSPAEARVLAALVSGSARDDMARALGISLETLKSHLARVYAKTGTSGQAELRNLVASLALPLRAPD